MEVNGETSTSLASGGAARRSAGARLSRGGRFSIAPPGVADAGSERGRQKRIRHLGGGEPSRRRTNSVSRPADRAEEWVPRRVTFTRVKYSEYHSDENPAGARDDDTRRDAVRLDRARLDRNLNPKLRFTLVLVVAVARHVAQRVVRRGDARRLAPLAPPSTPPADRFLPPSFPSVRSPARAAYEMASATPRAVATDSFASRARVSSGVSARFLAAAAASAASASLRAAHTVSDASAPASASASASPTAGSAAASGRAGRRKPSSPTTNPPFGSFAFRAPPRSSRAKRPRRCEMERDSYFVMAREGTKARDGFGRSWVGASRTPRWCEVRGESQSAGEPTATRRAAVRARACACRRCRC